jgi:hypothetical protein
MAVRANAEFPRLIWFMWLQGLASAPDIVKNCYASWKLHNPDWEIIVLDEGNLQEYVQLPAAVIEGRRDISRQALSDIARINALAQHGGVWVDATCFANVPVDAWLFKYIRSGFFAFRNPGPDRMLSSWFLASAKDCYLMSRWRAAVNDFMGGNAFFNQGNERILRIVNQLAMALNRHRFCTRLWLLQLFAKFFKAYPYFWVHYLFAGLVNSDSRFRQIWHSTPDYNAGFARKLRVGGLFRPLPENLKQEIDNREDPLYKLTWRYGNRRCSTGCTLDYLLRSNESTETRTSIRPEF